LTAFQPSILFFDLNRGVKAILPACSPTIPLMLDLILLMLNVKQGSSQHNCLSICSDSTRETIPGIPTTRLTL